MVGLEEKLAENNTVLKDLTDRRIAQESKERREREAQEKAKREQQEKGAQRERSSGESKDKQLTRRVLRQHLLNRETSEAPQTETKPAAKTYTGTGKAIST